MKYRSFGRTATKISEIGLGTWQLSGTDWGDGNERHALDTLKAAVDEGVNFFDTADVYGMGRSEEIISKFLKGDRAGCAPPAGKRAALRKIHEGNEIRCDGPPQLQPGGASFQCR